MYYATQDIVDAIITAGVRRGSDGRGKDGLDGRMFMLARTDRHSFGILLIAALRLKMKAKPEQWATRNRHRLLTVEEARVELRERSLPEMLLEYLPRYGPKNLPAELCMDAQPNGTRELMEATIKAAIRHGRDGRGRDGLLGYMLVLQGTKMKIFVKLMELAQQWQVAARSDEPNEPELSREECLAEMRARGIDVDAIHKLRDGEPEPFDDDEDPDPWGLNRPETIDVPPDDTETGAK